MKKLLALACLLLSLVNPAPTQAQSGAPLLKALEAGAKGRSVVLTWSRDGILATTMDGKFRQKLYDKPVENAALDSMADLLWFAAEQKIHVIDLRLPAREPRVVVSGFTATDFIIQGFGGAATTHARDRFIPMVVLQGQPTISVRPPMEGNWDEAENQRALALTKVATVVDQEWVTAQAARKINAPAGPKAGQLPPPPPGAQATKLELPEEFRQCADLNACGRFIAFGQTGLRLTVAFQNCAGGPCKKRCVLVDAAGKPLLPPPPPLVKEPVPGLLLPPGEPRTISCGPFVFNARNDSWINDGRVCNREDCQKVQGTPFAWLGGPNERADLH